MSTFLLLFFGVLMVAAIAGMVKIQRQELLDARAVKRKREAQLAAFRHYES